MVWLVLLALFVSFAFEIVAVFCTVVLHTLDEGTVKASVKDFDSPAARLGMPQRTEVPPPFKVQPEEDAALKVSPVGMTSVTVAFVAAAGP
ncbi:hypothetical protein A2412_01705 [Candidatus Peribacteria bacterium RIFOXYC1_FULL_58_8]|nr:MAG: hypothetical protein A2412_01705 [Candidatus Peribacteria bacterium RIFOXYC1_FULL_58_8]